MYKPTLNTSFTTQKWKTIPEYELEIYDDFKLDSVYYMFDNQTQWTIIKDNINASTYKITWKVPQEYWIGLRDGENRSVSFKITDVIGNTYISKEIKIIKDEIEAALVKFAEKGDFSVSPERIASHSEKKHSKTIIVIGKLGKGIQNTSHSKKEKKI